MPSGKRGTGMLAAVAGCATWGMINVSASAADTYATLESRDPRFDALIPAGTKIQIACHVEGTFGEADTLTAQIGLYGVWIRG